MIDVIVPVLGRPHNKQALVDSYRRHTPLDGCTLVFVCTPGDTKAIDACRATGETVLITDWPAGPGDYARKINHGYRHTSSEYLLNGSDDIEFTAGWAEEALKRMRGLVAVVATNDQANAQVKRGEFGTHCLIARSYVDTQGCTGDDEPGVVLWEGYDHNFVDRELCSVARYRHRYAFAKTSVIRHHHPLWRTAPWDTTYRKALAHFHDDLRLYVERAPLWRYNGMSASERPRNRDIVRRR